jgi:hypothetical protein
MNEHAGASECAPKRKWIYKTYSLHLLYYTTKLETKKPPFGDGFIFDILRLYQNSTTALMWNNCFYRVFSCLIIFLYSGTVCETNSQNRRE